MSAPLPHAAWTWHGSGPAIMPLAGQGRRVSGVDERCTVFLCRGCCCGAGRKHPHVDHAGQLQRVRERVGHRARVRVSDCLGPCERSNVAVVVPSRAARRAGARPVWLGWILDDDAADAIAIWACAGGPGRAAVPDLLELHRFQPPREGREPG